MSLSGAIERIQYWAGQLDGIKSAPSKAPESANAFPFAVTYPESGSFDGQQGWQKGLHVLVTEIHCARFLLPEAIAKALPYVSSFPDLLFQEPQLNGEVDTIVGPITYKFGYLEWDQTVTIGVQFRTTVKIQETYT